MRDDNDSDSDSDKAATPPANEREYVLWQALQQAPYPLFSGSALSNLYDQRLNWDGVDWLRDYSYWYQTTRLTALKDAPLGSLGYQLLGREQENKLLRDLLRKAYAALDNTPLMQDIAATLARLEDGQ